MALIGPAPTVAFVNSLVASKEGEELNEVFSEVIQFTDGSIFTSLAANDKTRAKLVKYLTPAKLKEVFPELQGSSDPEFKGLAFLADADTTLRPEILKLLSEKPEKESLTVISRLLASNHFDPKQVSNKYLDAILHWLVLEDEDAHWQGLATVIAKVCAADHKQYITNYVKIHQKDKLGHAAASALYDVIPELKSSVLSNPAPPHPDSHFFRLLSSLCNSKDDRLAVGKQFAAVIDENAKLPEKPDAKLSPTQISAMVVKAKLLAGQTSQTGGNLDEMREQLDALSQLFEKHVTEETLEGLACTASLPSVRQRAADAVLFDKSSSQEALTGPSVQAKKEDIQAKKDPGLVARLVDLLKKEPGKTSYPVTAVLVQLSKYPIKRGSLEDKAFKFRQQSMGETVFDAGEEKIQTPEGLMEALTVSAAICTAVINAGVLNWYTLNGTKLSIGTREQLALLLRELSAHQKRALKQKLAMQGAAVTAMYLYTEKKPTPLSKQGKLYASSAIARILLSIEPRVALTAKVSTLQAVPPICDLLGSAHEGTVEEMAEDKDKSVTDLDVFEALLALTNLASIDDRPLRIEICRRAWSKLPGCLNSTNDQVVRGALELICNLMLVPQSAEHFIQPNVTSKSLLSVLGACVTSEDRPSRLAAAGALAILAEWETASEQIGRNAACIDSLCRAMGLYPDDDDMLVRVLSALKIIIKVTTDDFDDEVVERIVYYDGITYMEELTETLDPAVHREVGALLVQCLHLISTYKLNK